MNIAVLELAILLSVLGPIPPRSIPRPANDVSLPDVQGVQIGKCREGILDPQARPEDRRRWIDLLFSNNGKEATALVVELLSLNSRPDCQKALCAAIADAARGGGSNLDPSYVEPLLSLLGAETEDLRAAASRALADFPGDEVPDQLGRVARDSAAPMPKRLAAIDALAPNTYRQDVVRQFLALDQLGVSEISVRVRSSLEPLAPRTVADWHSWWEERVTVPPTDWLRDELHQYRDRLRKTTGEFDAMRSDTEREQAAVVKRMAEFERDLLRSMPAEQRDARLVEWLDDPLVTVKLSAFELIRSRIADEGKRPEGEMRAALLRQLRCESAIVRRKTANLAANLSDPAVVDAVLARLTDERESGVRLALLRAAGNLGSAVTVTVLADEIDSGRAPVECVREAANALAQIAAKPESREAVAAVGPMLEKHYLDAPADQVGLRSALLAALAAVASSAYASDFESALYSDDPALLQAALCGIRAVKSTKQLPRCRTLVSYSDPRVRKSALEAIGEVGREDADVEAALSRMNPIVEPSEPARIAAWRAFREVLSRRNIRDRIAAADRLREFPDYQAKYLEELANVLSMSSEPSTTIEGVRDKLAEILIASGKDGEAVPHLRELYELQFVRSDAMAATTGLRWLDAALRAPSYKGLSDVIMTLAEAASDPAEKSQIVHTVDAYIDSLSTSTDAERSRKLIAELRTIPSDLLGDAWTKALDSCATKFQFRGPESARERAKSN